MPQRRFHAFLVLAFLISLPARLHSQMRLTLGVGGGIAGSTDQSLSYGTTGWMAAAALTTSVPLFQIGGEVNYLKAGSGNAEFATAIARVHLPLLPVFVKGGVGYGRADLHDGGGVAQGVAIQLGAGYGLGPPLLPVGIDLFANLYLAHGAARSAQMFDAGLSISVP